MSGQAEIRLAGSAQRVGKHGLPVQIRFTVPPDLHRLQTRFCRAAYGLGSWSGIGASLPMGTIRVGVMLRPQHTSVAELRAGWERFDALGVDSIWTWDHFFPLAEPLDGASFEGWTLLSAMAATTQHATIGMLVSGGSFRNPDLLADMARTVDHISNGRAYLGIGGGWIERDYEEYGYEFGTGASRLAGLEANLIRIKARLPRLNPPPIGPLPILVGGSGEKVTLRLVATYADAWNGYGTPEEVAHKISVLDDWCQRVGRNPQEIEKTVLIRTRAEIALAKDYHQAGATHLIWWSGAPYKTEPVEALFEATR